MESIRSAGKTNDDAVNRIISGMNDDNDAALSLIEEIVIAIGTRADIRIALIQKRYAASIVGGIACGTGCFVVLMVMFVRLNRRAQTDVTALSSVITSYLPPQFVRAVTENRNGMVPPIARKLLTICFTDLEGFTAASEGCEPEVIAKIINEYLSDMATIAQSRGGMVDKFMGDGIMIVFGAFSDDADTDALCSIDMAVTMQQRMTELLSKWRNEGFEAPLGLRVGINTGYATIGSIGPDNRRSFTAIGSAVNVASRLEKLCAPGKILIGYDTRVKVCSAYECQPRLEHKIKGISRSIHVFEIDPDGEHETPGYMRGASHGTRSSAVRID
jgi:class 3 adenylate cyclase